MRTLKAKASHYRFVVLELARREQEQKEAKTKTNDWKIVGFDSFDMEWYPIEGTYATEEEAEKAARARLKPVLIGQQDIQDRVFVEDPNGNVRRVFPVMAAARLSTIVAAKPKPKRRKKTPVKKKKKVVKKAKKAKKKTKNRRPS